MSNRDGPWFRLRWEDFGAHEACVDLEPGVWTDLKHSADSWRIALWAHVETDAYVTALRVRE